MSQPPKLLIVGLGLIGGSLALAAREAGVVSRIYGVARSRETIEAGLARGVIDDGGTSLEAWLPGLQAGDLVLLAAPTLTIAEQLPVLGEAMQRGVVVTDAGSVKGHVIAAARQTWGSVPAHFVPGHPIAGSEKSGVAAATVDLYRHRRVILTPEPETAEEAITRVQALWEAVGAEVVIMDAVTHDRLLAATSHLPHMLAYTLVDTLTRQHGREEVCRFAAGGFRDFTRIAASDPLMWHDIVQANREPLLEELGAFMAELEALRTAIDDGDSEALMALFRRASEARQYFGQWLDDRDGADD